VQNFEGLSTVRVVGKLSTLLIWGQNPGKTKGDGVSNEFCLWEGTNNREQEEFQ